MASKTSSVSFSFICIYRYFQMSFKILKSSMNLSPIKHVYIWMVMATSVKILKYFDIHHEG